MNSRSALVWMLATTMAACATSEATRTGTPRSSGRVEAWLLCLWRRALRAAVGAVVTRRLSSAICGQREAYPRITRTLWVAPSSTRGTRAGPEGSALPSRVALETPRLTRCGFSTVMS
jgi:hypothetical protein